MPAVSCPNCKESRPDMLDQEVWSGRWYCNACGRIFVPPKPVVLEFPVREERSA